MTEKPTMYRCDDCRERCDEEQLRVIKRLFERVQPGDIMPAGECPHCGGLCHADPEPKRTRYAVFSHDREEQQMLCDYVEAYDKGEAEEIVCVARRESISGVAAILTADDLRTIATELHCASGRYPTTAAELRAALGMEPEEDEEDKPHA